MIAQTQPGVSWCICPGLGRYSWKILNCYRKSPSSPQNPCSKCLQGGENRWKLSGRDQCANFQREWTLQSSSHGCIFISWLNQYLSYRKLLIVLRFSDNTIVQLSIALSLLDSLPNSEFLFIIVESSYETLTLQEL